MEGQNYGLVSSAHSRRPRGRAEKLSAKRAIYLFGENNVVFCFGNGNRRRVPIAYSLEPFEPIVFGPECISEWVVNEYRDWLDDESRLAPGMASGLPWE